MVERMEDMHSEYTTHRAQSNQVGRTKEMVEIDSDKLFIAGRLRKMKSETMTRATLVKDQLEIMQGDRDETGNSTELI